MRAVQVMPHGAEAVVYRGDLPTPAPGPGEVRVAVRFAALNRNDLMIVDDRSSLTSPSIIGSDGSGVVDAVGSDVTGWAPGDEVVVLPSLHWGDADDAAGPDFEILGLPTPGTHASHVIVPVENVRHLPSGWSLRDAAALPLAGLTAWRALVSRGAVRTGETVLVTGASGGVATFLIALGRDLGARVVATTSSPERIEDAVATGAEHGVLRTDRDWSDQVRAWSGGGVDLCVDSSGVLQPALDALRPGGRLVTLGRTVERTAAIDVGAVFLRHLSILGTTMGSPRDFDALLAHVAGVSWRPVIDSAWPLLEYADALARLRGPHRGKVLLELGDV